MNQILQWVNKIMGSNLELSWIRHFAALSGNVFQFQSDMSSICTIILGKTQKIIQVGWVSPPNRINRCIHWSSYSSFVDCEDMNGSWKIHRILGPVADGITIYQDKITYILTYKGSSSFKFVT